jgi:hypothetical protein
MHMDVIVSVYVVFVTIVSPYCGIYTSCLVCVQLCLGVAGDKNLHAVVVDSTCFKAPAVKLAPSVPCLVSADGGGTTANGQFTFPAAFQL